MTNVDIRVTNVYSAYGVYNAPAANGKKADAARVDASKDIFSLSEEAEDYQAVKKALAGVPDVRDEKVRQIMEKIGAGEYFVSASDVADKILQGI
jgi:negative regulator of flagellin synthesis FlgM